MVFQHRAPPYFLKYIAGNLFNNYNLLKVGSFLYLNLKEIYEPLSFSKASKPEHRKTKGAFQLIAVSLVEKLQRVSV